MIYMFFVCKYELSAFCRSVKTAVLVFWSQEDQDAGQSVGQRKRVKLSSSTKGTLVFRGSTVEPVEHAVFISCVLSLPSDLCLIDSLKHKCFLEELLFWTINYEFPQKLVTFLLNMLPDQDYKVVNLTWLFKLLVALPEDESSTIRLSSVSSDHVHENICPALRLHHGDADPKPRVGHHVQPHRPY